MPPLIFSAAFRTFFLVTGLYAAVMLPLWLVGYMGFSPVVQLPSTWHAHEMVFGFAGAAIGGFLLTAVPNWTNTTPVQGRPLMVLLAVWLSARLFFLFFPNTMPFSVIGMVLDLLYIPTLAVLLAKPLLSAGVGRNTAFLALLGLFWLANAATYAIPYFDPSLGRNLIGAYFGMLMVLVIIAVVGGRIIPAFTRNWLQMQGKRAEIRSFALIEKGGAAGSVAVAGTVALLFPGSIVAGVLLLGAAAVHLVRLSGWHGIKTLKNPILWILHLGYLWLVVGLALWGVSIFVSSYGVLLASVHALTAGCISTMILGVMSRASLGHSGRPLVVSKVTIAAYGLLTLAAIARVAAALASNPHGGFMHAAGTFWALAWILFLIAYTPILVRPRADGRMG